MRTPLLLVGFASFIATAPAFAQHFIELSVSLPDSQSGCALCHGTHASSAAPHLLKTGDDVGWQMSNQSAGVSSISRSCLRCHTTPERRARQSEFALLSGQLQTGRYLQLDLTDDHPMGRLDRIVQFPRAASLRRPTRQRSGQGVILTKTAEASVLDCTSCHDAHRRTGGVTTAEQQRICGECHESGKYHVQDHATLACSDCHDLHGGGRGPLLAAQNEVVLCTACHDPLAASVGFQSRRPAPAIDLLRHGSKQRGMESPCMGCHEIH